MVGEGGVQVARGGGEIKWGMSTWLAGLKA